MTHRLLVLAAHDARHPKVAGGDLLLESIARELVQHGWEVEYWSARAPGLARREVDGGLRIRRWGGGTLFPVQAAFAGALRVGGRRDLVLEQVIGSNRLPFLARLWAPRRSVGAWYQDNRPLFRAVLRTGASTRMADALQSFQLRRYRHGPLLVPSEATRDWLMSQGVAGDRIAVAYPRVQVPTGIEPAPFASRPDRFVVIGNFRATKRFEEAIEVLRRLRREVPAASAVLLGRAQDPAYLDGLRAQAAEAELAGSLRIMVNAGDREKFELLARSKALTVHSPIEGFGWTVPEAGAVGTPCVVNPGVPRDLDVLGAGISRVPAGDPASYVRVLARWMRSEAEWTTASRAARAGSATFQGPTVTANVERTLASWSDGAPHGAGSKERHPPAP